MVIDGIGISAPLEIKVREYSYDIDQDINWFQMSTGNWKASDRGSSVDKIYCTIKTRGKYDYIESVIAALLDNQEQDGTLLLTSINSALFGNNVDYTTDVEAVLFDINEPTQSGLHSFALEFILLLSNATFLTYALELPNMNALELSRTSGTVVNTTVTSTYINNYSEAV